MIFFLVTAVAVADFLSTKSGTAGKRDVIFPMGPHHFLNRGFLFELFSPITKNKDNKMFICD